MKSHNQMISYSRKSNIADTALITGATSGIGAAFARQLAGKNYNLVLISQDPERLASFSTDLQQHYGVNVDFLEADLSNQDDIKQVESYIGSHESLVLLINNAGFGTTGMFADLNVEKQIDMIYVHVVASVRFSRAILPQMVNRRHGNIINVASMGGFIPLPNRVTYGATKNFLVAFSEALEIELYGTGVHLQALCPGFTYTGFHDTPEFKSFRRTQIPRLLWMTADQVAKISLDALNKGRVICVPGFLNSVIVNLARNSLTSSLLRAVAIKMFR